MQLGNLEERCELSSTESGAEPQPNSKGNTELYSYSL